MSKEVLLREELEKRVEFFEKKYGPYIEKRGIHNWKNLFRWPNMYEWTILIMLVLVSVIIPFYNLDVKSSFTNGYNSCLLDAGLYIPGVVEYPNFKPTKINPDQTRGGDVGLELPPINSEGGN